MFIYLFTELVQFPAFVRHHYFPELCKSQKFSVIKFYSVLMGKPPALYSQFYKKNDTHKCPLSFHGSSTFT
jgi:hypothetical protein